MPGAHILPGLAGQSSVLRPVEMAAACGGVSTPRLTEGTGLSDGNRFHEPIMRAGNGGGGTASGTHSGLQERVSRDRDR